MNCSFSRISDLALLRARSLASVAPESLGLPLRFPESGLGLAVALADVFQPLSGRLGSVARACVGLVRPLQSASRGVELALKSVDSGIRRFELTGMIGVLRAFGFRLRLHGSRGSRGGSGLGRSERSRNRPQPDRPQRVDKGPVRDLLASLVV